MECFVLVSGLRLTSLFFPTEAKTNRKVMVISTDFTKDDIYESIKENIQDLDITVLGLLASNQHANHT